MSGAGGGVGSPFSGFQSCQGNTLNPGVSCQMVYSFSPTSAGAASTTSSGDWNGQNFSITLTAPGTEAQFPTPPTLLDSASLQVGATPPGPTFPPPTIAPTRTGTGPPPSAVHT